MLKDRSAPPGDQKKGKKKRVAVGQGPATPPAGAPAKPAQAPPRTPIFVPRPPAQTPAAPAVAPAPAAPPKTARPPAPARVTPAARPKRYETPAAATGTSADWAVSLESGLYVLAVLVALAVRVYGLGHTPLQEAEAVRAWSAWGFLRGLPGASLAGQSPLLVFGNALLFLLVGATDIAARLLPALVGSFAVLLPWALRRELGRAGALAASFLIALSPSLVYASRSVDGGMIVAAGALALLACAIAYGRSEDNRYVYVIAAIAGIMLTADRSAGPTLLILAAYALLAWLRGGRAWEPDSTVLRNAAAILLGFSIVVGTGFLTSLQGVQTGLVDGLTAWLGNIGAANAAYYLRALPAYEPLALLFALLGLLAVLADGLQSRGFVFALPALRGEAGETEEDAQGTDSLSPSLAPGGANAALSPDEWALRAETAAGAHNDEPYEDDGEEDVADYQPFSAPLAPFLAWWSVAALLLYALSGSSTAGALAQVTLPLCLLAGALIGRVLEAPGWAEAMRREGWTLAILLILIVFAVLAWANPGNLFGGRFVSLERRIQNVQAIILAAIVLLLMVIAAVYAYRLRLRGALLAVFSAAAAVLLVYGVHTVWQTNLVWHPNQTEPIALQTTSRDVFLLRQDLQEVSRRQGDAAIPVTIDDRLGQPLVWYLRSYMNVTVARASTATKSNIIIVPADMKDAMTKALGRDYVGQRYRLREAWTPAPAPWQKWQRWAIYRDPALPVQAQDIYVFYKLPEQ